jgi:type VI secretion system secreted protein VgrG
MHIHLFIGEGLGRVLRGVRLEGREALSELFHFEVDVVTETSLGGLIPDLPIPEIPLAGALSKAPLGAAVAKVGGVVSAIGSAVSTVGAIASRIPLGQIAALGPELVGTPARLSFSTGENTRQLEGIVVDLVQHDDGKRQTAYRVLVMPAVAKLLHRSDCRIFQDMTTPEIVAAVLSASGIRGFRFSLGRKYPKREYCVQYREVDWTFISRLLEEEGIHYFFQDEAAGTVLVMADGPTSHEPIPSGGVLPFRAPLGAMAHGEHVSRFAWATRLAPSKASLRDYNFKKPALSLAASAPHEREALEIYDAPGRYETTERGAELAAIRLEELRTPHRTGSGESDSCRLVPGRTFVLRDHDHDDLNGAYLVTSVKHRGTAPLPDAVSDEREAYENRFEVVTADAPFRPARRTARPVIHGIQTALVVGPKGEQVHTDTHGRIKVQFFWDRHGHADERSSCWIRVLQTAAGPGYGASFLPRVGHDVVVSFLEGDPDRPVVLGSLYHAAHVPPFALPQNKTQSGLRTHTVGGEGANELRFEDKVGHEEIYLKAQRDLVEVVGHDHSTTVHGKRTQIVDKDDTEHVLGDQALTVDGDRHVRVKGNQRTIIDGVELKPGGFRGGAMTIRGDYEIDASNTIRIQAPVEIKDVCGGSSIVMTPDKIVLKAGAGATLVLDANVFFQSAAGANALLDANVHAQATGGAEVLLDGNALAKSSAGSEMFLDANARMSSTGGSTVLLTSDAQVSSPANASVTGATANVVAESAATLAGAGGTVVADGSGVGASGGIVNIAGGGVVNVVGGAVNVN